MRWRWMLALALLLASAPASGSVPAGGALPARRAASRLKVPAPPAVSRLKVAAVERPRPGWMRIVARYRGPARAGFRVTPVCGSARGQHWVVASVVHVFPRERRAVIELRDDLGWLTDWQARCTPSGLKLEMVDRGQVLAMEALPVTVTFPSVLALEPPVASPAPPSRVGLAKRKLVTPESQTSEAGLSFVLNSRLALQLGYARTAFGRTMPRDTDNGVRTSLRVGF